MLCHIGGGLSSPAAVSTFKAEPQITWLTESPLASIEHWFYLAKGQLNGDIQLDIMLPDHHVYRGIIEQRDLSGLSEMAQDKTPPLLTEVKVAGIEKGLLLSATISWHTDELADTRISYGTDKLGTTGYIAEMSRSHQITIAPLQEATDYQFQAASADYLGNLAQASVGTFSTGAVVKPVEQELTPRAKIDPTWDRQLYQDSLAGLIILKVTTTVPSKVAVGITTQTKLESNTAPLASASKKPCQHQLKTVLETTIDVCLPCHESYVRGGTMHPLQVGPKPGKSFPPELFVLANGGINCMTCHSAHSSIYPNRLVKSGKEELCRGCHTDK
jgi:predicted CXXCH cytochrome family protein